MSLLRVRDLGKSFGGVHAVDGIDFDLRPGELLALIGPNGAGKSTTFNMINGQLRADRGSIMLDGHHLLGLSPRDVCRLGVARTFQIAQTFVSLTVIENVQMSVLSHHRQIYSFWGRAGKSHQEESMALLEQVGLQDQADKPTSALAYGDVKRLELAMALAGRPRLLLMDEPTAGMGPIERHALMSLTQKLVTEKGIAVLFTEHSMDVVFAYADRILVLARGRLIADGSPDEVREDPKVQQVYLGSGAVAGIRPRQALVNNAMPMLVVSKLCAWYGRAQALFDVSFEVKRGEVVALMGRNGAGKSTTMKSIMGMMERREGSVMFQGKEIIHQPTHAIARAGLGFVPEDRRIFTDLSVMQNLEVAMQPARTWADGSPLPAWTHDKIFSLFPNLGEMPRRPGGRMSGGEQQMLTVARTLMGNPYLVLLDEPSEGVAPVIVEQMVDMILTLKQHGVSILLSEQNLFFAELVSDRVYVLDKGQVCFAGSMSAFAQDEQSRQALLGVS